LLLLPHIYRNMGQKHSLEDDLITFRLTSKQMARSAKKCDKNMTTQTEKLKKAIKDGNMEGAKIYAQNVIREKNQSLNFLRLGSRIDAVASRLETAIRMQDINKAMVTTVKGMSNAMKSMEVEQIAKTMEEFERQFENMDVRSGYMESTMESTTSLSTPPEQVDNLIQVILVVFLFLAFFSLCPSLLLDGSSRSWIKCRRSITSSRSTTESRTTESC
jgi:charged multivesicular body protein 1